MKDRQERYVRGMFMLRADMERLPPVDTSLTRDLGHMLFGCRGLRDVPPLDTHSARDMESMFRLCEHITAVPRMDTSRVTDMSCMFLGCSSLTEVPPMDTHAVTDMSRMFSGCGSLEAVHMLDMHSVTDARFMFLGCRSLRSLTLTDVHVPLDLSDSPLLSGGSVLSVILSLMPTDGGSTVRLHHDALARLTPEELAEASEHADRLGWKILEGHKKEKTEK